MTKFSKRQMPTLRGDPGGQTVKRLSSAARSGKRGVYDPATGQGGGRRQRRKIPPPRVEALYSMVKCREHRSVYDFASGWKGGN